MFKRARRQLVFLLDDRSLAQAKAKANIKLRPIQTPDRENLT